MKKNTQGQNVISIFIEISKALEGSNTEILHHYSPELGKNSNKKNNHAKNNIIENEQQLKNNIETLGS